MKRSAPPDRTRAGAPGGDNDRAKRAAVNALRRARRAADRAGVDLSAWEGEFLGSVEARIETYGRAFADPEKGAPGAALSIRQTRKLKEIVTKAKGDAAKTNGSRSDGSRGDRLGGDRLRSDG